MQDIIRSRGGGLRLPQKGRLEQLFRRWRQFREKNHVSPGEEIFAFAHWLVYLSGQVVSASRHRREMAVQRVELAGERRLLLTVGQVERGQAEVMIARGTGADFVGRGVMQVKALPRWAGPGEVLLLTISKPRCRVCGCTDDQACVGGCRWVEPDLCSKHPRRPRRRSHESSDQKRG